jgi:tyrosyl-tRNA synthetase
LTTICPSRSEARKAIQNNAVSINKNKITSQDLMITKEHLIQDTYIMVENGKKNKYVLIVE